MVSQKNFWITSIIRTYPNIDLNLVLEDPVDVSIYTNSLVNAKSFYANFTNMIFQNVPIPHLTLTMKQKLLHYHIFFRFVLTDFT